MSVADMPVVFSSVHQVHGKLSSVRVDFDYLRRRLSGHHSDGPGGIARPLVDASTSLPAGGCFQFTVSVAALVDALNPLMRMVNAVGNIQRFIDFHLPAHEDPCTLKQKTSEFRSSSSGFASFTHLRESADCRSLAAQLAPKVMEEAKSRTALFTSNEAKVLRAEAGFLLGELTAFEAELLAVIGADVTGIRKVSNLPSGLASGGVGGNSVFDPENLMASPVYASRRNKDESTAVVKKKVVGLMARDPRYRNVVGFTPNDHPSALAARRDETKSWQPKEVCLKRSVLDAALARTLDDISKELQLQQFIDSDDPMSTSADQQQGGAVDDALATQERLSVSGDAEGNDGHMATTIEPNDEVSSILAGLRDSRTPTDPTPSAGYRDVDDNNLGALAEDLTEFPFTSTPPPPPSQADQPIRGLAADDPLFLSNPQPQHDDEHEPLTFFPETAESALVNQPLTPLLSSARSVPNQSAREETPGTSGTPVAASAQTIPNSSSLPSLGGNPKSPYAFLVSLADVKLPGATFVERLRGFVSKVTSLPTSPWSFFHGTESSSSVRDEDYYFNADTGQRVQSLEDVYADEYADIEVDMLLASKEWRCVAADHPSNTSGRPYFMNKALSVTTWNLQEWLKEH